MFVLFDRKEREKCIEILIKSEDFQKLHYLQEHFVQRANECVELWRESLADKSIADKISELVTEGED